MREVFLEQKVINGILHFRTHMEGRDGTPWMDWTPYAIEALTAAFVAMRGQLERADERIAELTDKLTTIERALKL